jgi:hypothetical protein
MRSDLDSASTLGTGEKDSPSIQTAEPTQKDCCCNHFVSSSSPSHKIKMTSSFFVALSIATAAFAASITPADIAAENVRTVDAATYKAFANGTLSPADLPPLGVIRILVESRFSVTDRVTI